MGACGQPHAPASLSPGKRPLVLEAGWAPGSVWMGAENCTWIRTPGREAYNESLYRLNHPGPRKNTQYLQKNKNTISVPCTGDRQWRPRSLWNLLESVVISLAYPTVEEGACGEQQRATPASTSRAPRSVDRLEQPPTYIYIYKEITWLANPRLA